MISCCLCGFQAFSKGNLSFHLSNAHFKDKEFVCRLCHFKTAYKGALTRHVNSVHLRTSKTKECPICGYVTESLLNLNNHLSSVHHLEIATAFARPSGSSSSSSVTAAASTSSLPPDLEVEAADRDSPPPVSPPRSHHHHHHQEASPYPRPQQSAPSELVYACRICDYCSRSQEQLVSHYNDVHLAAAAGMGGHRSASLLLPTEAKDRRLDVAVAPPPPGRSHDEVEDLSRQRQLLLLQQQHHLASASDSSGSGIRDFSVRTLRDLEMAQIRRGDAGQAELHGGLGPGGVIRR